MQLVKLLRTNGFTGKDDIFCKFQFFLLIYINTYFIGTKLNMCLLINFSSAIFSYIYSANGSQMVQKLSKKLSEFI